MDCAAVIEQLYEHLKNDHVDKATMACLRLARNLQDYLYAAIFLREFCPEGKQFARTLYDDTSQLKEEARNFLAKRSSTEWLATHTLPFSYDLDHKDFNVLDVGVGEIDRRIEQWEKTIQDLAVSPGMSAYDTAAFTDKYNTQKVQARLQITALQIVKQRIKARCLNYAIRLEKQLQTQAKSANFLHETQNMVNNYFKTNAEDVYTKLQKAAQLVDSNNLEDHSLILTLVRRAIKAAADYFYPPVAGEVTCSDGERRTFGDDQYLNRLQEYLVTNFTKTSSNELLQAELDYLAVFARKLNEVASKGVHSDVSVAEAKQGLIGLYMFLFNVISKLQ